MTGNEFGVRVGRTAAVLGRVAGATVRVVLPLLVMMVLLSARLLRRTAVLVLAAARAQLATTRSTGPTAGARTVGPHLIP